MPSLAADAREILTRLVAFDTTSRDSNLPLIAWVEENLAALGVESERLPNADGEKANLIAWIGPRVAGGVVLSGHTDVVPVDGQPWTSDPFTVAEREGRLYGRGVADMKAFSALALAAVPQMLKAGLKRPIILALSYDEEIGCLGAPAIVERLSADPARPGLVIVGEPSMMKVVSGHKGIRNFEVIVTGREGHSSAPAKAASAIMAAIPLLSFIADLAAAEGAAADPASLFDPKGPTLTVGVISGGTAPNILARECRFRFDLRATSNAEADRLENLLRARIAQADKAMKARAPEGGVEMHRRSNTPPLTPVLASVAEQFVRALTGDNGQTTASYAAEAGLFQAAGLPTVICGPGDIAQAHQPDEWIALSQIEAGAAFMERLIARLAEG